MHTVDALLGRDGPRDLADQDIDLFWQFNIRRKTANELNHAGFHA